MFILGGLSVIIVAGLLYITYRLGVNAGQNKEKGD
jgi:hypothetical protein